MLDVMLDMLHRTKYSLKLILEEDIIRLGFEKWMSGKHRLKLVRACTNGLSCHLIRQMLLVHNANEEPSSKLFTKFEVVYFYDTLIDRSYPNTHLEQLRQAFETLRQNELLINLEKCSFSTNSLIFLGYLLLAEGMKVDPMKIKAIHDWPIPKTISEVPTFHGLASLHRHFIKISSLGQLP